MGSDIDIRGALLNRYVFERPALGASDTWSSILFELECI